MPLPKTMPPAKSTEIFHHFSLQFYDDEYEQRYQAYSTQFTMQNFTYFFVYSMLAILIALIKNIVAYRSIDHLYSLIRYLSIIVYYLFFRKYGATNKFLLDLGFIFLIVSLYLIHLLYFFPYIFESFPGVNSYFLGSAIESLRIFLFTSKANWRLVVVGNMIMNFFNAYECLLIPKTMKENIFSFLFPFLMINTFPVFSYFYERNQRQIFYESMLYQKTLESYEYLIKYAFPNQIVIINEDKTDLLFCNEATKKFFNTKDDFEIFNEIKSIQLQRNNPNSSNPEGSINELGQNKDLFSSIKTYEEINSNDLKFIGYEGYLYRSNPEKKKYHDIYSEISFDIKLGKINWKNHSAYLLILTDISPLKLVQKLKEIDNYKDLLLATVSHDLRTPLNCMMGMLDLIFERIFDKKTRKYIKMALRSANLLLFMINDILDYSQITNKKFSLNNKLQELSEIINEVIDLIKFQCKKKKILFVLDVVKDLSKAKIIVDQLRLKQILLNLLGNALKFTNSGYVKLKISIFIHTNYKKYLNFVVEDTGVGIKKVNIPKLFHLFGKMPQERPEMNSTGVGLGLVISKRLSEMLCSDDLGGINVNSEYGKGSAFSFNIPMDPTEDEDIGGDDDKFDEKKLYFKHYRSLNLKEIDSRSNFSSKPSSCGSLFSYKDFNRRDVKNILVVDDDQTNIFVMKQYFEKFGFNYETAFNGREAIEQIIINKYFDLIIMDCNMPIMNGFEASKTIKKMIEQKEIPKIPILALTANVSIKDIEDCKKSGMDYYLSKPVSKKNLKEMLERIFNHKINEKLEH